jgi:hypothetical protein
LLAFWIAGSAHATSTDQCVPYTIAVPSTVVACGSGMSGTKFLTTTKACPSGTITQSTNYDTSGCVPLTAAPGAVNTVSKCLVTPDACAPVVTTSNCPTGAHWTLLGSKIAHCVQDDFACGWGQRLTHDALGNPSCVAITCPSTQVLQADGQTCGCPAGQVMTGSTCAVPPPTCVAGSTQGAGVSCPAPQSGVRYPITTTTCPGGAYGAPSTTTSYNSSGCTTPAVTCTSSTTVEYGSCSPNIGQMTRFAYTNCPSGAYGSPSYSYSSWDSSGCSAPAPPPPPPPPPCSTSSSSSSASCGAGYTGTQTITTTYLCPSGTSTSTDTSGCGCANGANNYPSCVLPAPPPPPPRLICPQNNTAKFSCTASGAVGSNGRHMETDYTDDGSGNGTCTTRSFQVGTCGYNGGGYWFRDY